MRPSMELRLAFLSAVVLTALATSYSSNNVLRVLAIGAAVYTFFRFVAGPF